LTNKKGKKKNSNRGRRNYSGKSGGSRRGKPVPKTTGKDLVRGLQHVLEKEGIVKNINTFSDLVIHDHTTHRIITDPAKSAKHFNASGKPIKLEVYVPKRSLAGCNEARLMLRTMSESLTADMIVDLFCKNNHWIINPQETVDTLIGLMQDEIINRDIVDRILNYEHPVWSQLDWEEDTALEADFVNAWIEHPNMSNDSEDALKVFNEDKPNFLRRKAGSVEITVTNAYGEEKTFKYKLAIEQAQLDKKKGRSRYFLGDARGGASPFRSHYMRLHGFRGNEQNIRGKATNLNYIAVGRPKFLQDEIEESRNKVKLGDFAEGQLERGEDMIDLLMRGETISNNL
tara:strand:- start:304 stop:1332 length:1029 start_codon:yes stop_codon:yes gene_type:complete